MRHFVALAAVFAVVAAPAAGCGDKDSKQSAARVIDAAGGRDAAPGGPEPGQIAAWIAAVDRAKPADVASVAAARDALVDIERHVPSDASVPLFRALVRVPSLRNELRSALVAIGPPVVAVARRALAGGDDELLSSGPPATVAYDALSLLGDLRATDAVDDIVAVLGAEPLALPVPSAESGPAPTTHDAAIEALAKIGASRSAQALLEYGLTAADPFSRLAAIQTHAALAPDASSLPAIEALIRGEEPGEVQPGYFMAGARLAVANGQLDSLRALLSRLPGDAAHPVSTALKAAGEVVKCERDVPCLITLLRSAYVTEAIGMHVADRVLVELARLGPAASAATPALLELLPTTNRILREGAVSALKAVAPLPCDKCVERLDRLIERQADQPELAAMTAESRVVRSFFRWAATR